MLGLLAAGLFAPSASDAQDASDEVKEALFHAAMAAGCPNNDDEVSIELAQAVLDFEGFDEISARSVYYNALSENPEVSQGTEALACGMVERIEQDHPHR